MCFHVQIKLLRVTVSSALVRSVPGTTCAKYTIYRARPQFVKLSEMLRDGWMGGWMYGWMEMMAAHFYVCSLAAAEYSPEELPATPP